MLGGNTSDTRTITSTRVGINTINPNASLHVSGNSQLSGNLLVQGSVTVTGGLSVSVPSRIYRRPLPVPRRDPPRSAETSLSFTRCLALPLLSDAFPSLRSSFLALLNPTRSAESSTNPRSPLNRLRISRHHNQKNLPIGLMVTLGAYAFCKVDASTGPIASGDLLTTSASPGYAQHSGTKVKPGAIIGKALAPCAKGRAVIPILVSHQ